MFIKVLLFGLVICVRRISGDPIIPCDIVDSVDISDGTLHSNNGISFNGVYYPEGHYFEQSPNGAKRTFRGCPCKLKPCVRLCCPFGSFLDNITIDEEFICRPDPSALYINIDIFDSKNQSQTVRLDEYFGIVEKSCKNHYYMDNFVLKRSGDLLIENELVTHREYCLEVKQDQSQTIRFSALQCYEEPSYHIRYSILPYAMIVSVSLILLTLIIYTSIPELMNLLGQCLVCLLISLTVYYVTLTYVYLHAGIYVPPRICAISAYTIYFAYFSAALWLNVISFDLWLSFRSTIRLKVHTDKRQFLHYTLYVYGISFLITLVAGVLDSTSLYYKPGFAAETCFLSEEKPVSKFIYFYMPIGIIFISNIVLFILTAFAIFQTKRKLNAIFVSSQGEYIRTNGHFTHKKYSYVLYLRLFIVMGVTWSMDAITFVSPDGIFFLICDLINNSQGVFIFILFVLKPRMLHLIKKRFNKTRDKKYTIGRSKSDISYEISASQSTEKVRLKQVSLNYDDM